MVEEQQEFLNLILEAAETGDKTKLAEWWHEHFPGYKWWLIGPAFELYCEESRTVIRLMEQWSCR